MRQGDTARRKCDTQPGAARVRNADSTRKAILKAARRRFLSQGYDQSGVRAIAADAGIDAALICRYFGSKEGLFSEVLDASAHDPMEVLAGERATLGQRLAEAIVDPGRDSSRMDLLTLISRSSTSPMASKLVLRHLEKRFILPLADWLGEEAAREKSRLMVSVLMGITMFRKLSGDAPAARERLAAQLQNIIDAP